MPKLAIMVRRSQLHFLSAALCNILCGYSLRDPYIWPIIQSRQGKDLMHDADKCFRSNVPQLVEVELIILEDEQ